MGGYFKPDDEDSELMRVLRTSGMAGLAGSLSGISSKAANAKRGLPPHPFSGGPLRGGLYGAAQGAASQGLGDLILGQGNGTLGSELGRGALGGSIVGGLSAIPHMGKTPGGLALVNFLMKKGLSKNKAIAAILGGAGVVGAAQGALGGAVNSSMNAR